VPCGLSSFGGIVAIARSFASSKRKVDMNKSHQDDSVEVKSVRISVDNSLRMNHQVSSMSLDEDHSDQPEEAAAEKNEDL